MRTCGSDKRFGLIDVRCGGNAAVMESLQRRTPASLSNSFSGLTVNAGVILFAVLGMLDLKVLTVVDGHPAVTRCSDIFALFWIVAAEKQVPISKCYVHCN